MKKQPKETITSSAERIKNEIKFKLLTTLPSFQKEVAERIASSPGSKKNGILSVLLQSYYHIEYLFTVNETVFYPPPKVKSGVIRLRRNDTEKLDCDEDLFVRVVKTAFNQRRKTLKNSLKSFNLSESSILKDLLGKRAEQLSVSEFVQLTKSAKPD